MIHIFFLHCIINNFIFSKVDTTNIGVGRLYVNIINLVLVEIKKWRGKNEKKNPRRWGEYEEGKVARGKEVKTLAVGGM
jgi:GTPase SAR1 family protein